MGDEEKSLPQQDFTVRFSDGDRKFTVTKLDGERSYKLVWRLGKALGPALGEVFRGDASDEALPQIIASLYANLTEKELDHFVHELVLENWIADSSGAMREIDGAVIKDVFRGEAGALLQCLVKSAKFNFEDFIGGLAALGLRPAKAEKSSSGPNPSSARSSGASEKEA